MHRSTNFVLAALMMQVLAPGQAFGGAAPVTIVLLDQERGVWTMAIVPPCDEPTTTFASDEAIGFEPFESQIASALACEDAGGSALAQQFSLFSDTVISVNGSADSSAFSEVNTIIHAIPSSFFEASFELADALEFELVGTLSASGAPPIVGAYAQARLTNAQNDVIVHVFIEPDSDGAEVVGMVNESGTLAAGTYTLRVDGAAVIDSTVPPGGDGSAFFDIEFRVFVPGDINHDSAIDGQDQAEFCAAIGSAQGDPAFNAAADLNDDAVIDHLDQQMFNTLLPPCDGDVVSNVTFAPPPDGVTDAADLAFLLGEWANQPSCADFVSSRSFAPPPDGKVDGADLAFLLGAWGACD